MAGHYPTVAPEGAILFESKITGNDCNMAFSLDVGLVESVSDDYNF